MNLNIRTISSAICDPTLMDLFYALFLGPKQKLLDSRLEHSGTTGRATGQKTAIPAEVYTGSQLGYVVSDPNN